MAHPQPKKKVSAGGWLFITGMTVMFLATMRAELPATIVLVVFLLQCLYFSVRFLMTFDEVEVPVEPPPQPPIARPSWPLPNKNWHDKIRAIEAKRMREDFAQRAEREKL